MDNSPPPPISFPAPERVRAVHAKWMRLSVTYEELDAVSVQVHAEHITSKLIAEFDLPLTYPLLLPLLQLARELLQDGQLLDFPKEAELDAAFDSKAALADLEYRLNSYEQRANIKGRDQEITSAVYELVRHAFLGLSANVPRSDDIDPIFTVCVLDFLDDPVGWLYGVIYRTHGNALAPVGQQLQNALRYRLDVPSDKPFPSEHRARKVLSTEVVARVIGNSVFSAFFAARIPCGLPRAVRFEHVDLCARSGHGKTQCLEALILADIQRAQEDPTFGFCAMDSQGDLLQRLGSLRVFDPTDPDSLAHRLVIIDPAYPIGLNLFDLQLEQYAHLPPEVRQRSVNSALDLYKYLFADLLGAQLTQKQSVVFTFLAKLIFVLPNPTLALLKELLEDPAPYAQYFAKLDPVSRDFFSKHFFHKTYADTRQQIITRLFGLLADTTFQSMFSSSKNSVDIYHAMQHGKIIFINTNQQHLQEHAQLFGRFFIALITQATTRRAEIPEAQRNPFHFYIDEAWEYLDEGRFIRLVNQGRKYRVGITVTHPNLANIPEEVRHTMHASLGTKIVGGCNAHDAASYAREMHTTAEVLQGMRKARDRRSTHFGLYINAANHPTTLKVRLPFGGLDKEPTMSKEAYQKLLRRHQTPTAPVVAAAAPVVALHEEVSPVSVAPETPASPPVIAEPSTSRSRRRSV